MPTEEWIAFALASVGVVAFLWAIIAEAARQTREQGPAIREEFDLECWLDAPAPHTCRHEWANRPREFGRVCVNCGLWVEHGTDLPAYGVPAHVMRYRRG